MCKIIRQEKFVQYLNYIEFLLVLVDENKNHKHIRGILKLLLEHFPDYDMEAYILSDRKETPEELYERLTKTK